MAKEFPGINTTYVGEKPGRGTSIFLIGILKVDEIVHQAQEEFREKYLVVSKEQASMEFQEAVGPAYLLLATAVSFCNRCPVRRNKVCRAIQIVDFRKTDNYRAQIALTSEESRYGKDAKKLLAGAKCKIVSSALNDLHPIKMEKPSHQIFGSIWKRNK